MSRLDLLIAVAMTHPFYMSLAVIALGALGGVVAELERRDNCKRGTCR